MNIEKKILIFGFGKWSKTIISYLKKNNKFHKIYVKTSSEFFQIYPQKKIINIDLFRSYLNDLKYIHICTPAESHFRILKLYNLKDKRIIIEKPLVTKKNELDKIKFFFKSNKIIVNYIDLYNQNLSKIKKKINNKSILHISLGNQNLFKKKNDCLNEWLDHPLAIILSLFKKFKRFEIIYYLQKKVKNTYFEEIYLKYTFQNNFINIKINNNYPKVERVISLKNKSGSIDVNLKPKTMTINSKKNNLNFLYDDLKNSKKYNFQDFSFHRKIFLEKRKIIKKINEKR